jgi:hypothetical protein
MFLHPPPCKIKRRCRSSRDRVGAALGTTAKLSKHACLATCIAHFSPPYQQPAAIPAAADRGNSIAASPAGEHILHLEFSCRFRIRRPGVRGIKKAGSASSRSRRRHVKLPPRAGRTGGQAWRLTGQGALLARAGTCTLRSRYYPVISSVLSFRRIEIPIIRQHA